MDIFFTFFIIGISLSMDAFSLSVVYGTSGISFHRQVLLSFIVGLFHFFMPLIGYFFGMYLQNYFLFSANFFVSIVFGFIGVEMLISLSDDKDMMILGEIWEYFIFGFTVSLDSLTTGIGLSLITNHYIVASTIFMICSGLFTFLGLSIGRYFKTNFDKYATLFGGIIMIILSLYYGLFY